MHRWLIAGLFYDIPLREKDLTFAVFTVKDEDIEVKGKKLISIRKAFLSCTDPTEYEFAMKYTGGWEHWKVLQDSPTLKDLIASLREEFEVKMRAEAIKQIITFAKTDKGYQAAKFLADCGWKVRAAGAPSKEEKEGFKKNVIAANKLIEDDAERLGLVLVKK